MPDTLIDSVDLATIHGYACSDGYVLKIRSTIGFLHPDKKAKLDEAINSFVDSAGHFPLGITEHKGFVLKKLKEPLANKTYQNRLRVCSNKQENVIAFKLSLNDFF